MILNFVFKVLDTFLERIKMSILAGRALLRLAGHSLGALVESVSAILSSTIVFRQLRTVGSVKHVLPLLFSC